MPRDLVLATAMGYGPASVRRFVESLRRHYDGEIGFLVTSRGPNAQALLDYLAQWRVTPHFFDTALWMITDVQVGRYVRYYEILRGASQPYDRVLFSDVSDVVFQAHPFDGAPAGDLLAFLEHPRQTIGACQTNTLWITDIFGADMARQLAPFTVSCSGTTIGSHRAMCAYVEKLLSHAKPPLMMKLQGKRGHDQGIHNMLLHTGALPGVIQVENGTHVFTLGRVPDGEVVLTADAILTVAGRKPAIVHQYNYRPAVNAWVETVWPLG